MWRAINVLRHGGGMRTPADARARSIVAGGIFAATAIALVVGMLAAHVPQERL